MIRSSKAFAPASIGNLAVGFDVLGLAIAGAGDTVRCERVDVPGVQMVPLTSDPVAGDCAGIPLDPARNTAAIAADSFWQAHGDGGGLRLALHKGTPLASGMGSSAASAVAAVVAANGLLAEPLPKTELLKHALVGEAYASGALHADNVAPALLGGLVLCPPADLPNCFALPVPAGLASVLVHPDLQVETAAARRALAPTVPLGDAVAQSGALAMLVDAAHRGDAARFARSVCDVLIEPQRKHLVEGFDRVKAAALAHGALACSLSGSGPSLFALCPDDAAAGVAQAMVAAFAEYSIAADAWCSPLDAPGAEVQVCT